MPQRTVKLDLEPHVIAQAEEIKRRQSWSDWVSDLIFLAVDPGAGCQWIDEGRTCGRLDNAMRSIGKLRFCRLHRIVAEAACERLKSGQAGASEHELNDDNVARVLWSRRTR